MYIAIIIFKDVSPEISVGIKGIGDTLSEAMLIAGNLTRDWHQVSSTLWMLDRELSILQIIKVNILSDSERLEDGNANNKNKTCKHPYWGMAEGVLRCVNCGAEIPTKSPCE